MHAWALQSASEEALYARFGSRKCDGRKRTRRAVAAGIMVDCDGLAPSSQSKRIAFNGPDRSVIDGPFAQVSEIVAGFWIWEVKDLDEALTWGEALSESDVGPE